MHVRVERIDNATLYLGDSAEIVKRLLPPGGGFALVTDPPYGIGADRFMAARGGRRTGNAMVESRNYEAKGWDDAPPDPALLDSVREISRWQIIFSLRRPFHHRKSLGRRQWRSTYQARRPHLAHR